jgi:hypothetical protein
MNKWLVLFLPLISNPNWAYDRAKDCETSTHEQNLPERFTIPLDGIKIQTNAIFDESDPETIFLHRFANWIHINTQAKVISERLPFKAGDSVSQDELAEAERILRGQPFIRDASVKLSGQCDSDKAREISIQTWDTWSLLPTISFGRKGGKNKLSVGAKEDNLLGLGIRTKFKYNSDDQRTGYELGLQAPLSIIKHSTIYADLEDNDDGQLINFVFDNPFYQTYSEHMSYLSYLSDEHEQQIYQNGDDLNRFIATSHRYDVAGGWLWSADETLTKRLKLGFTQDKASFTLPELATPDDVLNLPEDRDYSYPWVGIEFFQSDYKILSNIYLISQAEDINLGWHHDIKLGYEVVGRGGYHLGISSSKGYEINSGLLLLSLDGQANFLTGQNKQFLLNTNAEYFKRYTPLFGFYARAGLTISQHQFIDTPVIVGGESGVRGYPLQYQHGAHTASASVEARFYPHYTLYKILDFGFAAFADAGRAWSGDSAVNNETNSVIASVGLGLRIYSNRSSHHGVVHLDMVKPMHTSENVDSWEWRLQLKDSF